MRGDCRRARARGIFSAKVGVMKKTRRSGLLPMCFECKVERVGGAVRNWMDIPCRSVAARKKLISPFLSKMS